MKKTTHSKYLFQKKDLQSHNLQPIIIGYKIKTPENIGSIIRLADNTGCKEVFFIPDNEPPRKSKIKKTAASSFNSLKWSFCSIEDLKTQIPDNYEWIALETSSDSENLFSTQLPKKIALFVGNEIAGIDLKVLDLCKKTVHIPLVGNNTSMNVSHALTVAIFEWQRQMFFS